MRTPAPSRSPITHRRRPTTGVSAIGSPPHRAPRDARDSSARRLSIAAQRAVSHRGAPGPVATLRLTQPRPARRLRLDGAPLPDDAADDFDDDERDEPSEQHVAEIVAAEGEPQEARAEPEGERSDDRETAPGGGEYARRRDHPEAGRGFAGDEGTVLFAAAADVIPGHERARSIEILGLDRTGPMPMILEAEIDDEARPDDHRGDEKDHRSAARRPAEFYPTILSEPQRRISREHDERRHAEKVAAKAFEAVATEEAAAVVKVVGARQVKSGPDRENGKRQRGERNIDEQRFVHLPRIRPRDRSGRFQAPRCCG